MSAKELGQADRIKTTGRRNFIKSSVACLPAMFAVGAYTTAQETPTGSQIDNQSKNKTTNFVHACMTLPYSNFSLQRALQGIRASGYHHVAWGVTHRDDQMREVPVLKEDAPPQEATELGKRCRDMGLEPVMMFSTVYPEQDNALEIFKNRIKQAAAAGIDQVLTFGHTQGARRDVWVERFKTLGPIASDHGVTIVIKQHGGGTGSGQACEQIVREIDHPNIKVNYDAGNVMDYLDLDPIADLKSCASEVRSFCIKDHRNWPVDQDCGPGFGEIDHYRLLEPVAFTGQTILLAYENISAPLLPSTKSAEDIDVLARRAREYLETVINGLQMRS